MTTEPVTVAAVAEEETFGVRVPGRATGPLLGGNLCLIAASAGTPDLPDLTGAVLLIEDVQEPPYKVDRMLTQLRRAGALDRLAGVAVGQFTDCADNWDTTVVDVLTERLGDLGVPVLGGLPIGHGPGQLTVPVGTEATLDTDTGSLTVQPAVA
jgi:muramoyltetrapeptide carboxypeptidase